MEAVEMGATMKTAFKFLIVNIKQELQKKETPVATALNSS